MRASVVSIRVRIEKWRGNQKKRRKMVGDLYGVASSMSLRFRELTSNSSFSIVGETSEPVCRLGSFRDIENVF